MDEKHVISLYEFSTQANEYYAYIGMRSSLRDDYKYETHIQISIFDVDALHYLLDNIFIRFDSKLYRRIVGIPMGTNCAPLVADLFCFVMRETLCCL